MAKNCLIGFKPGKLYKEGRLNGELLKAVKAARAVNPERMPMVKKVAQVSLEATLTDCEIPIERFDKKNEIALREILPYIKDNQVVTITQISSDVMYTCHGMFEEEETFECKGCPYYAS